MNAFCIFKKTKEGKEYLSDIIKWTPNEDEAMCMNKKVFDYVFAHIMWKRGNAVGSEMINADSSKIITDLDEIDEKIKNSKCNNKFCVYFSETTETGCKDTYRDPSTCVFSNLYNKTFKGK